MNTSTADSPTIKLSNTRAFDLWARSYDEDSNPLLTLEQRYLERILARVSGRDVLDAGCGSGRWLRHLAEKSPRSLTGIDISAAMLLTASQKRIPCVELVASSCEATPFPERAFDLILSSFVLSYVDNLCSFAREMTRISRSRCDLFLTDMHPDTQARLGWKRSFHSAAEEIQLRTTAHPLVEIVAAFTRLGWKLCAALQPEFGARERQIFGSANRLNRFHEAEGNPAIYVLHLRKQTYAVRSPSATVLRGARVAFGPAESSCVSLALREGRVDQIVPLPSSPPPCSQQVDLSGYLLMPGFVNAHDHLEFALFPRLAGAVYPNATVWARDIHHRYASIIARHRSVPKNIRLWWGALRNLLCGVTTVCHHNPLEAEFDSEQFPVRVVRDFGWAHSIAFGEDLEVARSSTPRGTPFIIHAGEGVDEAARDEIFELDRMAILDESTVIVHGLAMDAGSVELMRRRHASLIACPSSNYFLFGRGPDMRLFEGIRQIALASDSSLTAVGDLLDEVRFAIHTCAISPQRAYSMLTETPAEILRLQSHEGCIKIDALGDLIAIPDTNTNPALRLRTLSAADVELVLIGGHVQLASCAIMDRLPAATRHGLEPLSVGSIVRWVRAPVRDLLRQAEGVLGPGNVRLAGKPVSIPAHSEVYHAC